MALALPEVPRSLEEAIPASQARSKIQAILDRNREQVEEAVIGGGQRDLARMLRRAEAELALRLADEVRRRGDETYTASDLQAQLLQVRAALAQVEPRFVALLARGATKAAVLGAGNTVDVLRHFEGKGANVRPLAIREALALRNPRLTEYPSSVARYGRRTIGVIAEQLQVGVVKGETFSEMTKRLTGSRSGGGLLVQNRAWAERIVRTEGMASYAIGADEEMKEQVHEFPDLKRKIIATFDKRTGADSKGCHGEVRALNEPFVDGYGRVYLLPPARPNDREVVIPWREAWLDPKRVQPLPASGAVVPAAAVVPSAVEAQPTDLARQAPGPAVLKALAGVGKASMFADTPTSAASTGDLWNASWKRVSAGIRSDAVPAWAQERLGELHEHLKSGDHAAARQWLREVFALHGLRDQANDDAHPGSHQIVVVPPAEMKRLVGRAATAAWLPPTGAMLLLPEAHAYLMSFLEKAQSRSFEKIRVEEFTSFRILLHELIHSTSPINWRRGGPYSVGFGAAIEEGTTDALSFHLAHQLLGMSPSDIAPRKPTRIPPANTPGLKPFWEPGSYEHHMAATKRALMDEFHLTDERAESALVQASLRMRRQRVGEPAVATHDEWLDRFASHATQIAGHDSEGAKKKALVERLTKVVWYGSESR